MKDGRYQHQSLLVKLWRQRWTLLVPYWTLTMWVRGMKFKVAHSISLGTRDVKMRHVFYLHEVMDTLGDDRFKHTKQD